MEVSLVLSGLAVTFAVVNSLRTWWRDRRSDALADGRHVADTREALARVDERLKRLDTDVSHAVRDDMMGSHLAALEARMRAEVDGLRIELRSLERRREVS